MNILHVLRAAFPAGTTLALALSLAACGGNGSDDSGQQPPPDTTSPSVSAVEAPARINRSVTLSVTASDNVGVTEVRFFVDGTEIGSVSSAPFSIEWDTSGETDGDHVLTAEAEDAAGNVATSAETTVTVANVLDFTVSLAGTEEVPAVDTTAGGEASLTVDLVSGAVEGEVTTRGLTPTAAHIHDAFAGDNGPILIPLDQDPNDASVFAVPAGALLDDAGIERLLAGALYVNVHTDAQPAGAVRGQILPAGFVLNFAALEGRQQVPRAASPASGRAAITLDTLDGTLVVHAQVTNLDNADQAHVHDAYAGANGPVLVPLAQDPMDAGHWFVEDGELNEAGLEAFAAGRLYVNVHTPGFPGGEIRGQIVPEGITLLFAELSGGQEVPAVETPADGLAALTLDESASLVTIHANTRRLPDADAAHLHGAYGGVNGPVEIGLMQDGSDVAHWFAEEQALSAAQLDALRAGATYVNVHTPDNPGGEIRGQVVPEGILFASGRLEGRQEVPSVDSAAGGTFAVTVDPAAGTLVAHANTDGVDDATAAHLHDGIAGTSGPVEIGLEPDASNVSRWSAVDAPIDMTQLAELRAGNWYLNVHTPANPGGEIRGQVAIPPVEVLFTETTGDQEVPGVNTAATGLAASTVDRTSGDVTLHLRAEGVDDATAAHIHSGFAGRNGPVLIGLTQDGSDAGHWFASGEQFDAAGLTAYLAGELYVNLHTPANPGGELRGQLAPKDVEVLLSPLDGDQVVPPVTTAAAGVVATTVDRSTREFVAWLNASDVDDATSAAVHSGEAGANGPEVLPLAQTPMQPGQWSVMSGALEAEAFEDYLAGRLYVQVATPAEPGGEIRGQIVPPDAPEPMPDQQAPTVTLTSPGATVSGTVTLEADASDDIGVVEVRFLAGGSLVGTDTTAPYSVDWDTTSVADGDVTLTAEAEDAAGNVGTSAGVDVTVENTAPVVTLTQIEAEVSSPICAACHTGPTSSTLPSGMDLTSTAASFAALVDVASIQVPALDRVEPGDPDNSYLIHKLEGTQSVGTRMPQGGPFLDQATIDMIRQWIADGAPNN